MVHRKRTKLSPFDRILAWSWGSQGAREGCQTERSGLDSSWHRAVGERVGATMNACSQILAGSWRSEGAREACKFERLRPDFVSWRSEGAREPCKIERLRPDLFRELEVGGCAGSVQH